jgi:basic membrane protein A and related proteins
MGPSGGNTLKKTIRIVAVLAAASLAVAGAVTPASAAGTKACLALDTGGVDDKSFNASAWAGAQSVQGSGISVKYLVAQSDADYAPNIKKLVDEGCNIVIGVGFLIAGAIEDAAKKNPNTNFAIVDSGPAGVANHKALLFATNQSSFLAGYLAASYSKTGVVATYGGMNFPGVTDFMDGFVKGVAHYNKVKKKSVKALGWDPAKKDGTFVGNFSDSAKALQISKNFELQNADVIFPVAGGLGGATAQNAMTSKKSVVIWVDSDGVIAAPQYKSVLITSVLKGVGTSVAQVIRDQKSGKFSNTPYLGTIKNKGTGLAPFYDYDSKISQKTKDELKRISLAIAAGSLKI